MPLELFTPPTDSLYKFMALVGVLLFVAIGFLSWSIFKSFEARLLSAKIKGRLLVIKIGIIQDWGKDAPESLQDQKKTRDEVIELACLSEENSIEMDELEKVQSLLKFMAWLVPSILAACILFSSIGFYLWYERVQKYQDMILKADAVKRHEP